MGKQNRVAGKTTVENKLKWRGKLQYAVRKEENGGPVDHEKQMTGDFSE